MLVSWTVARQLVVGLALVAVALVGLEVTLSSCSSRCP